MIHFSLHRSPFISVLHFQTGKKYHIFGGGRHSPTFDYPSNSNCSGIQKCGFHIKISSLLFFIWRFSLFHFVLQDLIGYQSVALTWLISFLSHAHKCYTKISSRLNFVFTRSFPFSSNLIHSIRIFMSKNRGEGGGWKLVFGKWFVLMKVMIQFDTEMFSHICMCFVMYI